MSFVAIIFTDQRIHLYTLYFVITLMDIRPTKKEEKMLAEMFVKERKKMNLLVLGDPSKDFAKYVEFHGTPQFWIKLNNCRELGQEACMYFERTKLMKIIRELAKTYNINDKFIVYPYVCCHIPNVDDHFLLCEYLPCDGEYIFEFQSDADIICGNPTSNNPYILGETRTCKTLDDIINTFEYFGFTKKIQ